MYIMWYFVWPITECWNYKLQRTYIIDRTKWSLQCSAYILCVSNFIVLCSICNFQSCGKADLFTSPVCFYHCVHCLFDILLQHHSSDCLFGLNLVVYADDFYFTAIAWSPHHCGLLATGGVADDRCVHFLGHAHRTTVEVCRHWLSSLQSGSSKHSLELVSFCISQGSVILYLKWQCW
jgi:hypothetical protein